MPRSSQRRRWWRRWQRCRWRCRWRCCRCSGQAHQRPLLPHLLPATIAIPIEKFGDHPHQWYQCYHSYLRHPHQCDNDNLVKEVEELGGVYGSPNRNAKDDDPGNLQCVEKWMLWWRWIWWLLTKNMRFAKRIKYLRTFGMNPSIVRLVSGTRQNLAVCEFQTVERQ